MQMPAMVSVSHLFFSYSGAAPFLLSDVTFEISAGDYVSILGKNGAGKTTLMRLLLGFLKPSSGRISLASRSIGYVPQMDPASMEDFPIKVGELLSVFASARGLAGRRRREAVDSALASVGMADRKEALFSSLSGGQRQRVLISRALLGGNQLLILDEPSTGVDPESREELYALLRTLNRRDGMTIIAVEHNLADAMASSTRLIHMQAGRVHLCSPDAYRKEELLSESN